MDVTSYAVALKLFRYLDVYVRNFKIAVNDQSIYSFCKLYFCCINLCFVSLLH